MKKWYNNGITEQMFDINNIPNGWNVGRLKSNSKNTLAGKHWYNNGEKAIMCFDDNVPDGYVKGVLPKQKEHLKRISGNSKGLTRTAEQRDAQSERAKEYWKLHKHPWLGKTHSDETKKKISDYNYSKTAWNKNKKLTQEEIDKKNTTLIEHFGTLENYYTIQSTKAKATKLLKYGDENYNNRVSAKETIQLDPNFYYKRNLKTIKTCQEKYGVNWPTEIDGFQEQTEKTLLEKYGVHSALELANYKNKNSKPNLEFLDLLNKYNISFDLDKDREFKIDKFRFDFKINNNLIEINPSATHNINFSPWGQGIPKNYHFEKSIAAKNNNYHCIHIWDWDDQEKIINTLLTNKPIIGARKCSIKKVDKIIEKAFLNTYHLQNYINSNISLGLFYENNLISIMTFGKPRYNKNYDYELLRYCSSYKVIGGAEKLFQAFIKLYQPRSVISYCDLSKFNGNVYTKLGFKLKSKNIQPSKHWYNLKTKQHVTDNLLRQRGFDQLFGTKYGKGTSNEILMKNAGFIEIYDCGQATYIFNTDGIY